MEGFRGVGGSGNEVGPCFADAEGAVGCPAINEDEGVRGVGPELVDD